MLWPQALFSAWLRSISFVFQAKHIFFYSTIALGVFHMISSLKALNTFVANNWQDKVVLPWSPNSAARFERLDLRRCLCGSLSSCGQHDSFLNSYSYPIFVTGTTGGACVKIFCQVYFFPDWVKKMHIFYFFRDIFSVFGAFSRFFGCKIWFSKILSV